MPEYAVTVGGTYFADYGNTFIVSASNEDDAKEEAIAMAHATECLDDAWVDAVEPA